MVMNCYHDHGSVGPKSVCEFQFCQAKLDLKTTECNTAQGSFERSFCDESKQADCDNKRINCQAIFWNIFIFDGKLVSSPFLSQKLGQRWVQEKCSRKLVDEVWGSHRCCETLSAT